MQLNRYLFLVKKRVTQNTGIVKPGWVCFNPLCSGAFLWSPATYVTKLTPPLSRDSDDLGRIAEIHSLTISDCVTTWQVGDLTL